MTSNWSVDCCRCKEVIDTHLAVVRKKETEYALHRYKAVKTATILLIVEVDVGFSKYRHDAPPLLYELWRSSSRRRTRSVRLNASLSPNPFQQQMGYLSLSAGSSTSHHTGMAQHRHKVWPAIARTNGGLAAFRPNFLRVGKSMPNISRGWGS